MELCDSVTLQLSFEVHVSYFELTLLKADFCNPIDNHFTTILMEIIEKIQSAFSDVDEVTVVSIAKTCCEMINPLRLDLAFGENDQTKLEIIQSKRKEAKDKIKEMGMKAQYAVDLYYQHLEIEYKKQSNDQPFTVPISLNPTSIFQVYLMRFPEPEDQNYVENHLECALASAQKVCAESILWTIFYSELEDMEQEVIEEMSVNKGNELAENTASVKEYGQEIKIKKKDDIGLPITETMVPSKFLQIFKERGVELFDYFQSEYILDDGAPVAKYSYIYRFLAYEQLINARSQSKYREFIKDTFGVNMSKIFPENDKFNDDIHRLLSRLKSDFERKHKSEMNRK